MSRNEVLKKTLGKKRAKKYITNKETIELSVDPDCLEAIVRSELTRNMRSLAEDLRKRKAGGSLMIFDADRAKDIALLRLHVHCFETVLKYYGEP